jgi:GMP synthase (glutamine-hydrolysing)
VAIGRLVPTLGICFGHQLIAHRLGGNVEHLHPDRTKLEGFRAVTIDALWDSPARSGLLYASHREVVTSCPDDMTVIATRPDVPFEGFAHRTYPVWTFQTHPEATPRFVEARGQPADADYSLGHSIVDEFIRIAARRT